jgi:hypothetical protein
VKKAELKKWRSRKSSAAAVFFSGTESIGEGGRDMIDRTEWTSSR